MYLLEQHNNNMAMGAPNNIVTNRNMEFICDFDEKLEKAIILSERRIVGVILINNKRIRAKNIVFATGRSGSKWLEEMTNKYEIQTEPELVDLGVRMEVPWTC